MGCFSWVRAEATTSRSNLCEGDGYKILVPIEFGGGYIKDIYPQYGDIFIYASEPNAEKFHAKGYFKYYDAEGNVTDFYELRQTGGRWDLYGVLAYWNGCKDLLYSGDDYPVTMVDILLNGMTDHQDNRYSDLESVTQYSDNIRKGQCQQDCYGQCHREVYLSPKISQHK